VLERDYQARLIQRLKCQFKGCVILKNDSSYLQGIPDLLILYKNRWAMLEVKPSKLHLYQPNQDYYIQLLDGMSFAAVIYPENEEDVLDDLQYAFSARRSSRLPKRK
jgi:hypothetical protein